MPHISKQQGNQIRQTMHGIDNKEQKKAFLYSLLGYKVPSHTEAQHKEIENKISPEWKSQTRHINKQIKKGKYEYYKGAF